MLKIVKNETFPLQTLDKRIWDFVVLWNQNLEIMEKKKGSLQLQLIEQFDEIVSLIKSSRNNIIHITNTALIDLYWNVGEYLYYKLSTSEWGSGVVNQLSEYITKKYPEIKGFSNKNLWRMKQFYENYSLYDTKLSPLVREINWTNNMIILSRTKSIEEKDDEVVEYALNRSLSPTMVAEYQLHLPDKEILQLKLREIFDEIT